MFLAVHPRNFKCLISIIEKLNKHWGLIERAYFLQIYALSLESNSESELES